MRPRHWFIAYRSFSFRSPLSAVGCPEVEAPSNGWVQHNGDTLSVGCNHTQQAWHLTCTGTSWAGKIGRCHPVQGAVQGWTISDALEDAGKEAFVYGDATLYDGRS